MSKDNKLPLIEIFSVDHFFIFVKNEHSLWWDKRTGHFYGKPACELPSGAVPQCIGTCIGIIGKVQLPGVLESKLLLIKQCSLVGQDTYKIKSICILQPSLPEAQPLLNTCSKHNNVFENEAASSEQKSRFAKTFGVMKTASNTIRTSTQQAAAKIISKENKLEKRMLEELGKIFNDSDSFYFSLVEDLTNSLQRRSKISSELPMWQAVDDRFFWNKYMVDDIMSLGSPLCDPWVIPIIQGFVQREVCRIEADFDIPASDVVTPRYQEIHLQLISRRSRHRAGTRYKRRGVNDEGHVANYVETEQILYFDSHVISFVQIRGSVPVYWSQPGYKYRPPPTLLRGPVETQAAFNKHFAQEKEVYGPICVVNLVEQGGKEFVIWDAYTNHILSYNDPSIIYCTFDFHEYCRGMHFENVSYLVASIEDVIRAMAYCWTDKQGVICEQNGVFRVNCVDCLDRTNVVQTSIGKYVLEMQLTKLGLLPPEGHLPSDLRAVFQKLWANSGDVISRQYAGTNALKGDYTRTGERKFSGLMKDGMNSANRYCRAHIRDGYRQAAIDITQGVEPEQIDVLNDLAATTSEVVSLAGVLIPESAPTSMLHVAIAPEAELCKVVYLTSRYYLSRFKDAYRQATIDIMLGHEVSEDVFSDKGAGDDEDAAATAEHVKILLDDCKKLLINDPMEVLGCWGLIDADPVTGDPSETEMDTILILTKYAYYVADYDEQVDRVSKYQRVNLRDVRLLEVGTLGSSASLSVFKKQVTPHCIRIHYVVEDDPGYFHAFRSTGLRFFNNVAVQISTPEEMLESLKAICETFLVALEVAGLPPVPSVQGKPLDRLKSKVLSADVTCRLGSYLAIGSAQNISRNVSETQLNNLKIAGTKALSNISQQFSKMGKLGQSFRRPSNKSRAQPNRTASVKPPVFSIEPVDDNQTSPTSSQTSSSSTDEKTVAELRRRHYYIESAGLLMCDLPVNIPVSGITCDPPRPKSPFFHAKTQGAFDPATLNHSLKMAQEKKDKSETRGSSSNIPLSSVSPNRIQSPHLLQLNLQKRASSEKNLSLNLSSSQSESALKSITSNLVNVIASPASATKEMLSPLSKLAKGVHTFSANLDPRKLKSDQTYRLSEAHLDEIRKLEDKWTGCQVRLIAL